MSSIGRQLFRFATSRRFGQSTPIGIDFDSDYIHWAQVARAGNSVRLRDACSTRHEGGVENLLASGSDLKSHVAEVLRRGKFSGKHVVTQAPTADLRLMVLNYTEDGTKSEAAQILGLARERMRDQLLDHVVDYVPIRTSGEQQGERSALVAVAREEPVIEHLERLRSAGLEVRALEIAPVAIRRLIAREIQLHPEKDDTQLVMIIRLGLDTTELTLMSGRRLLLYRELETGTRSMVDALAKSLDCERDSAVDLLSSYGVGELAVDEVGTLEFANFIGESDGAGDIAATLREILRPCLRTIVEQSHKAISYAAFQTRGTSIEKIFLMPGSIRCPGLDGLLAEMLQLPVDLFRPLATMSGAERLAKPGNDQRIAVALGFAMRGIANA